MRVERDELGLFIDMAFGAAIRPAGFSSLAEGDNIDVYPGAAFCPLHGVGKLPGRGQYKEVWLIGPLPQHIHDQIGVWPPGFAVDREVSMRNFLLDLGTFLKANPDFDSMAASQDIGKLRAAKNKFIADAGPSVIRGLESELIAIGKHHTEAQQAMCQAKPSGSDPYMMAPAHMKLRL